jgi:hypothetical protein
MKSSLVRGPAPIKEGNTAMTVTLIKAIHDIEGRMHKPGERARVIRQWHRANFDARSLYKVTFDDGSAGDVFEDEVEFLIQAEAAAQ